MKKDKSKEKPHGKIPEKKAKEKSKEKSKEKQVLNNIKEKELCDKYDKTLSQTLKPDRKTMYPPMSSNIFELNIEHKKEADGTISLPNNFNEYRHLISNNKVVKSEIDWVLKLRDKSQNPIIKMTSDRNFTFYDKDVTNFKKKLEKDKKVEKLKLRGNSQTISHMLLSRPDGSPNIVQVGFETTMRNFKLKNDGYIKKHKEDWKPNPYKTKTDFYFSTDLPLLKNEVTTDLFAKTKDVHIKPINMSLTVFL